MPSLCSSAGVPSVDWAAALARMAGEAPVAMVTVLATEGSAPRGRGTRMLVTAGAIQGTIGGGRLEHVAIEQARGLIAGAPGGWRIQDYPLGPLLGQCCGGRVRLLLEHIDPARLDWLAALRPGATLVHRLAADGIVRSVEHDPVGETPSARGQRPEAGAVLRETLDPPGRPLLLFGAGHVGCAIAARMPGLPFLFDWYDTRADVALREGAAAIDEAAALVQAQAAASDAAVLILTHDHGLDYRLAAAALGGKAEFVGLIGSASKSGSFRARLVRDGIAGIGRLVCPIGIEGIAGKQPAVIAVAVLAQLLARAA